MVDFKSHSSIYLIEFYRRKPTPVKLTISKYLVPEKNRSDLILEAGPLVIRKL